LLWDALRHAEAAQRFTRGKRFEDYLADDLLRSAVERQLEIVGEALSHLARSDPATAGHVPELRRIIGFRNILAHGYESVDDSVVWDVVTVGVLELRAALQRLIDER